MRMPPETRKAPVGGTTEASSVKTQPITEGFNVSDSKAVQVSSQPVFNFGPHSVRVVVRDGEPWFVASDVCGALDYKNTSKAIGDHLDDDERTTVLVPRTHNDSLGVQTNIISESGLYALVLRSRKPEARKFAKWVTSEVLPAIRKTGVYVGKAFSVNPGDVLTQDEQNTLRVMLKSAVERLPKDKQAAATIQGWSKLKSHFGVPYREIPRHEFSEAVSIIARHTTEWELVAEKLPNAIVSLPTLRNRRWLLATDFEGREVVIPVPDDASMISFTKDSYYGIVERIPMERIPDMLAELQKRVASHIGAFSAHLQRGSAQRGAQCS